MARGDGVPPNLDRRWGTEYHLRACVRHRLTGGETLLAGRRDMCVDPGTFVKNNLIPTDYTFDFVGP